MKQQPELSVRLRHDLDLAIFKSLTPGAQKVITDLVLSGLSPDDIESRALESVNRQYQTMPEWEKKQHACKWYMAACHAKRIQSN